VGQVCIAIVGKYNRGTDAYLSIVRALGHAAVHANRKLEYRWVDSEHLQDEATAEERAKAQEELDRCDGILVPGGFGDRGIEGKIRACRYARETLKPFLGVCLGLQVRLPGGRAARWPCWVGGTAHCLVMCPFCARLPTIARVLSLCARACAHVPTRDWCRWGWADEDGAGGGDRGGADAAGVERRQQRGVQQVDHPPGGGLHARGCVRRIAARIRPGAHIRSAASSC
jgi:hypothetical protein